MKSKLILSLVLAIFLIGVVCAAEFDNVKSYDAVNKEVTITNTFGLGEDIAKATLETPDIYYVLPGKDRKVAEFQIDLLVDDYSNVFKRLDMYNVDGLMPVYRDVTYKIKTIDYYDVEVEDYREECVESKEINKTSGKPDMECTNVATGRHLEQREREVWTPLSKYDLTKGKVTIGIFTDVYPGDYIEWIPTMFGVSINEWAKWTAVNSYLNFTFDDATNYSKNTGTFNLQVATFTGTGKPSGDCISGTCFNFSSSSSLSAQSITNMYGGWSMWINASNSSKGQIMASAGAGVEMYQILFAGPLFRFYFNDAGGDISFARILIPNGTWQHVYTKCNATGAYLYLNGTLKASNVTAPAQCKFFSSTATQNKFFGLAGAELTNTTMDEVKFFNVDLTDAQILDLYNTESAKIDVNLNSPADYFNASTSSVQFNCSITSPSILGNISLWTNKTGSWASTASTTTNGANMTTSFTTGGKYLWGCQACDTVGECVFSSTNRTLNTSVSATPMFGLCGISAEYNIPIVNYTFRDSSTLAALTAYVISSFNYSSTTNATNVTYNYNSGIEYSSFSFCGTQHVNYTVYPNIQYASLGYPLTTYAPGKVTYNNVTTNVTLDLASSATAQYVSIQVINPQGQVQSGVLTQVYLDGNLTSAKTTDSAGIVTFFLDFTENYIFNFSKSGCTSATTSLTPTQTQYTQSLTCNTEINTPFVTSINGVTWLRYPGSGIVSPGNQLFTYYVYSSSQNLTGAKFEIINLTGSILNSSSSICGPRNCSLNLYYNVTNGASIKGRYYVNVSGGYVLIEADAYWRAILTNASSTNTIKDFMINFKNMFYTWGDDSYKCGNYVTSATCEANAVCKWYTEAKTGVGHCIPADRENKQEFSRIVFIFLLLAIIFGFFNKFTNYSQNYPGSTLVLLWGFIIIGSLAGGRNCANNGCVGLFHYSGLFQFNSGISYAAGFLNNYILAIYSTLILLGYFFRISKRQL